MLWTNGGNCDCVHVFLDCMHFVVMHIVFDMNCLRPNVHLLFLIRMGECSPLAQVGTDSWAITPPRTPPTLRRSLNWWEVLSLRSPVEGQCIQNNINYAIYCLYRYYAILHTIYVQAASYVGTGWMFRDLVCKLSFTGDLCYMIDAWVMSYYLCLLWNICNKIILNMDGVHIYVS